MTNTVTAAQFEFLRSIDTPTVCNLLEMVAPERRGFGYTVKHLHCPFPDLPPIVGFAKTVTMRAKDRVPLGEAGYMNKRLDYLDYIAAEPQPGIAVIQDLDDIVGYGAFWGEVQTNIHKALGCLGVITNGSIRDIPMVATGFQMLAGSIAPSHAYVHVVDFGRREHPRHGGEERRSDPRRPARRRGGAGRHHRAHEGRSAEARRQRGADHRSCEIRQGRRSDQGRDEGLMSLRGRAATVTNLILGPCWRHSLRWCCARLCAAGSRSDLERVSV